MEGQAKNDNVVLKVVLVGDSLSGKTSIFRRASADDFREEYKSTIGVEFGARMINIEGKQIKLQIWDTVSHSHTLSYPNYTLRA